MVGAEGTRFIAKKRQCQLLLINFYRVNKKKKSIRLFILFSGSLLPLPQVKFSILRDEVLNNHIIHFCYIQFSFLFKS